LSRTRSAPKNTFTRAPSLDWTRAPEKPNDYIKSGKVEKWKKCKKGTAGEAYASVISVKAKARQFFLSVVILIVALSALQIREFGFGVRNSWILRAWHCRLFTQVVELAAT
jgi:hypothetical protein